MKLFRKRKKNPFVSIDWWTGRITFDVEGWLKTAEGKRYIEAMAKIPVGAVFD
jgi:hypothetical protein